MDAHAAIRRIGVLVAARARDCWRRCTGSIRLLGVPRNGVVIAITALAIVDLLHMLRPTFIHPQDYLDSVTKLVVAALAFGPFLFGLVLPLEGIFNRLCDSKLRKSYFAAGLLDDVSWYFLMGVGMFLSHQYGWLCKLSGWNV